MQQESSWSNWLSHLEDWLTPRTRCLMPHSASRVVWFPTGPKSTKKGALVVWWRTADVHLVGWTMMNYGFEKLGDQRRFIGLMGHWTTWLHAFWRWIVAKISMDYIQQLAAGHHCDMYNQCLTMWWNLNKIPDFRGYPMFQTCDMCNKSLTWDDADQRQSLRAETGFSGSGTPGGRCGCSHTKSIQKQKHRTLGMVAHPCSGHGEDWRKINPWELSKAA